VSSSAVARRTIDADPPGSEVWVVMATASRPSRTDASAALATQAPALRVK